MHKFLNSLNEQSKFLPYLYHRIIHYLPSWVGNVASLFAHSKTAAVETRET